MVTKGWSGAALPCDALAAVIGHVAELELKLAASRVCRAWRSAAAAPRAWSSTTIDNHKKARRVTAGEAAWLIGRYGPGMRSLSVADERPTPTAQGYQYAHGGPQDSIITPALVAAVAGHCPKLRSLELRARSEVDDDVAAAVVALAERAAAGGHRMGLLGCNVLRGEGLARCAELVGALTSGECGDPDCPHLSGRPRVADFFSDAMLARRGYGKFQVTLHRCTRPDCRERERGGGVVCTVCAGEYEDSDTIAHCRKCARTCCSICSASAAGRQRLGPDFLCAALDRCPNFIAYGDLLCAVCCPVALCSTPGCDSLGQCADCFGVDVRACDGCGKVKCAACARAPVFVRCDACGRTLCSRCRASDLACGSCG